MKRILISLCTLTMAVVACAQQLYTWQLYPAYTVCTKNIPAGKRVYALMESKLIAYDTEDQSIKTFDALQQLSDGAIAHIAYSEKAGRIVLIYDNGNIDLLSTDDDEDVINLAHLKNSTLQNKQVNSLHVSGKMAYVCTGFGVMVMDADEAIVTNTYSLNLNVMACAVNGQYLYIGTTEGIWRGNLRSNLQDKSKWEQLTTTIKPTLMESFDGRVWAKDGGNLYVSEENGTSFTSSVKANVEYISTDGSEMVTGNASNVFVYTAWNHYDRYQGAFTWSHLSKKGNTFWASDGYQGLQAYQLGGDGFQVATANIHPNSPLHDYSFHLKYEGERLLVSGGNRHYSSTSRPGTAMILESDGTWTNFDPQSAKTAFPKEKYQDVTNIAQDPNDANHHYVGTARSGIFEFRDAKCIGHIGLENSPLQSILPDNANPQYFTDADGLRFDDEGNLWVLNCTQGRADTTLRVRLKSGSWTGIPCPEVQSATTLDIIYPDSKGRLWINSRRMTQRGIFMLDYNGTIQNSRDDKRYLRGTIINQDGTSYSPDEFYCIKEDLDGNIWIGTNQGPFVITEPDNFTSSSFTFEQIKVSRNDGSGLADYLLSGIPVTAITIDAGGRKWFGTQGSGVYLFSEDCQEEIAHFTTDNSPLMANEVFDIAINAKTGLVMFATSKGLCSYMAGVPDAIEELTADEVYAYPNPVEPDYHGPIAIQGLVKDSEVKIISNTGQLVWSGHSTGGTFVWNGCNQRGARVASGIYHVIANTPDGNKAIVTKIAFVR